MSSPDLYVVSLPGLLSEQHDGDAGEDAGQHAVEETAFAEILSVLIDLAEATASAAHALK